MEKWKSDEGIAPQAPTKAEAIRCGHCLRGTRIVSPGMFEQEGYWAPYFYHQYLDGGADEVVYEEDKELETAIFHITGEEKKHCPELETWKTIILQKSSEGFVIVSRWWESVSYMKEAVEGR